MSIKFNSLLCLIFLSTILACDKIEEGKYKQNPGSSGNGTPGDTSSAITRVLIEDYTGHQCPNCPEGHKTAEALAKNYPDKVIILTIHAGIFAKTNPDFPYNFVCSAGDSLDKYFKMSDRGNPSGMINRFGGDSTVTQNWLTYGEWGTKTDSLLKIPSFIKISLNNNYDSGTRKLVSTATVSFTKDISSSMNISLFLKEDSIIKPQLFPNPTGRVPDYLHRNVLRAGMNGYRGSFLVGTATKGQTVNSNGSVTLKTDWVPSRCSVVAFVSDRKTNKVLQVIEKKMIP